MAKTKKITQNQELSLRCENFTNKINSQMHYKSDLTGDDMSFDWVIEMDSACPYIDNLVRNPKVALVKEEDIVILEKAKKTSVASVKHLSRNTRNIDTIDEETNEVTPSKLLIERNEETFNTYENRFLFTLIDNMSKFIMKKEAQLDDLKIMDDKVLEYASSTIAGKEKIKVEMKISANDLSKGLDELEKEVEEVRKKIARMKEFLLSWRKTEYFVALEKAHVPLVIPPIKKTNLILKNPNFQIANKLWDFLQNYDDDDSNLKDNLDTEGDNLLKGVLDDAFLMDYFVLDSISSSKKEQKNKLAQYAVIMINQLISRAISILMHSGIEITDEQILDLITAGIKKERNRGNVEVTDVKNKFKSAFDEYFEKTKDYL